MVILHNNIMDDSGLLALIKFHNVNTLVGAISSLICTFTVVVFFSSTQFLRQNKLLALFAVADLCSSLGIFALGLMRKALYEYIVETSQVPLETIWSCASKPYVYLRLIGVIIPPWVVFWISLERFMAVFAPNIYRHYITPRCSKFVMPTILCYTIISVLFVYSIAWTKRNNPVEAYCGRKKIFSKYYSIYTFAVDIITYSIALCINCITTCRLVQLKAQYINRGTIKKLISRVHYMLLISLVATLTVSVPNALFLSFILFGKWIQLDMTDPANWMIAAKCSANLFVYILFKKEFRVRIYELLGCISTDPDRERQYEVSALGNQMPNRVNIVGQLNQHQQQNPHNKMDSISALADLMLTHSIRSHREVQEVGAVSLARERVRRSVNF